ncbi:retron Ec48 family effector membrane protein [Enterobacter cloacae]|uniref:retron Ec48 family effector membrane protein n=1 Tax=Enterobacter cloacae TaxID=550 RepID=UPI002175FBC4|nr:retron Ec48 family effector membrane protein [Enterobacter cloacae]UWA64354.1 retron Ec48 family effector membrane protein [Enterobacter cloacae]HDC4591076.1 retron Ec48 family effector membrane protein [Enterobacter cloacae]HEL9845123.1 retron Ec48 family effector membrane protein [Klebsiella pneumoniae]
MSKNKKINANSLVSFVRNVCIFAAFILCWSLISTIFSQELYNLDFCLQSECIDFFSNKISGVVKLAQFFGGVITLIAALGGAIIALRTYISGVDNSNITNHIAHFSMFRDFVNLEVSKRKKISPDSVDIHLWYSTIFPESRNGNLTHCDFYKNNLGEIKGVIEDANCNIADLTGKYKYQTHQHKMKKSLEKIGIAINNGPKNIFIDIEFEILSLIDSVNQTFIGECPELCQIERKYS